MCYMQCAFANTGFLKICILTELCTCLFLNGAPCPFELIVNVSQNKNMIVTQVLKQVVSLSCFIWRIFYSTLLFNFHKIGPCSMKLFEVTCQLGLCLLLKSIDQILFLYKANNNWRFAFEDSKCNSLETIFLLQMCVYFNLKFYSL